MWFGVNMFDREAFPIVTKTSLKRVARTHSLRCDSRQSESRFIELDSLLDKQETCFLGDFLPNPIVKGSQPNYLQEGDGIPVINTLSVQKMQINIESCRRISLDDFDCLPSNRKLRQGDVVLTMDGGTSIGKVALFDLDGEFCTDSHVAILRPVGISPSALVFLLASPLGQIQFQRFESGASGQTAITEEDLRRFRLPVSAIPKLEAEVDNLTRERQRIETERAKLLTDEKLMWESFTNNILS